MSSPTSTSISKRPESVQDVQPSGTLLDEVMDGVGRILALLKAKPKSLDSSRLALLRGLIEHEFTKYACVIIATARSLEAGDDVDDTKAEQVKLAQSKLEDQQLLEDYRTQLGIVEETLHHDAEEYATENILVAA